MKIMLLLASIMLTGCGQGFIAIGHIDPEFRPYVERFMEATGVREVEIDIYFDDQTGNIIGRCIINGRDRDIEIDPAWWYLSSDVDREIVIFHELAHCVLGQRHRNYSLADGCPGSIMDEYHIGAACYTKHYNYYIEELVSVY